MEQTSSAPPGPPSTPTPQPNEQPQPPQQPPPSTSSSSSSSPSLQSSPNPSTIPKPQITQPPQQSQSQPTSQNSLARPPFGIGRPWQQNPPFPHFSSITHHSTSPSSSSIPPSSSAQQRGGMAIGVPAQTPPPSFSSMNPPSFNQPFGGLGRGSVNLPDSGPNSSSSQVRQPMQGMGMMGSLGSGSSLRPTGVTAPNPLRPVQPSSLRPQAGANNQSPAAQNFQGHGMLRAPSVGSPGSPSPNTSQSSQPHNQPWLSSGSQGKPPLPPPSYRPQMTSQSLQQRSHIPQQQQQQHTISTAAQQHQTSSSTQSHPPALPHQQQEHYSLPPSRVPPQSLTHQQQIVRGRGLGNLKPTSQAIGQSSGILPPPPFNRTASAIAETGETCNRILSKRSIQELLMQIDPSERLDPEVEDILVDIADEFVESITTFGCSLAKHRKSNTLEAKDILLHLERNWNMTLPGFSGDEIKIYKKPSANDIHRERLAAIKKSAMAAETTNSKSSAGQVGGSVKSHPAKAPAHIIGSPNPKIREAA